MTERKRLILVLGMHRGGTSAVTRGLAALGVSLGERMMPAHAINEKGLFEDLDIFELDEALPAALGDTWHGFLPIAPERFAEASLRPRRKKAVAPLGAKLGATPLYGIKDPRLPRLLPFWLATWQAAIMPELSWMRFADTTIAQLQATEARHDDELARLEGELATATARITALEASTSWRITAPLRPWRSSFAGRSRGTGGGNMARSNTACRPPRGAPDDGARAT